MAEKTDRLYQSASLENENHDLEHRIEKKTE